MRIGYNTNGLAHHSLHEAVELLASLGYESVAITLDHAALNPYALGFEDGLKAMRAQLEEHGMRSVVETGARYLLDPRAKHSPTLLADDPVDRARRMDFLMHAVDAAAALGSDCVSLWSGTPPEGCEREAAEDRLYAGLREVLDYADACGVMLGFEPEPGMLIDTMERFAILHERVHSPRLRLTLDVGHLHCLGETPIAEHIHRWGDKLLNVHIEDMREGVHEHLMFGEGEIDFPPVIAALRGAGYHGGLHVELSRHSHVGPQAAAESFSFLAGLVKD
ncbi:MAG: sugar phosphate isomerase/epimerase family protein [Planctomycetota bacterium]